MPQPSLPLDTTSLVPGSRICVAISGGADSVALLCALSEARQLRRPALAVGLSAVHVNHGLRGDEAENDEVFVRLLCDRLQVPLQIHRVDVRDYHEATGETLEQAARTLRYQIFHSILAERDVDDLLTAHTLDDQAETVLMKLLRGAWMEGLSGIYPVLKHAAPKRILRPLLGTRRLQVLEFLRHIKQPWREDSSNTDLSYTRNRLRHRVLPMLRLENPSIDQTLAHLAELAREEEDHWQDVLPRMLPQFLLPGNPVRGGGRSVPTVAGMPLVALDIDRLRSLDKPTRRRILRAAARSLRLPQMQPSGEVQISFDETTRLLALCGFHSDPTVPSRAGTVLQLSQGLSARRSARELVLALDPAHLPAKFRDKQ